MASPPFSFFVVALAGSGLLAGCTAAGLEVQERAETVALVSKSKSSGMDSEVRGTVVRSNERCLALQVEGSEVPVTIIWPKGSRLDDGGESIDVPSVGEIRQGQRIEGSGGEVENPQGERFEDVPKSCLTGNRLIDVSDVHSAE